MHQAFKRNLDWEERIFSAVIDESGSLVKFTSSSRAVKSKELIEFGSHATSSTASDSFSSFDSASDRDDNVRAEKVFSDGDHSCKTPSFRDSRNSSSVPLWMPSSQPRARRKSCNDLERSPGSALEWIRDVRAAAAAEGFASACSMGGGLISSNSESRNWDRSSSMRQKSRRRSCNDLSKMKAAIKWGEHVFETSIEDSDGSKMSFREHSKFGPQVGGSPSPYNFNWDDDESTQGDQSVRAEKVFPKNNDTKKTRRKSFGGRNSSLPPKWKRQPRRKSDSTPEPSPGKENTSKVASKSEKNVVYIVKNLTIVNNNSGHPRTSGGRGKEHNAAGNTAHKHHANNTRCAKKTEEQGVQVISSASAKSTITPIKSNSTPHQKENINIGREVRTLDNLISKIAVKTSSGQIGRRVSFNALTRAQLALDDALNPIDKSEHRQVTEASNQVRGVSFRETDYGSYWF